MFDFETLDVENTGSKNYNNNNKKKQLLETNTFPGI